MTSAVKTILGEFANTMESVLGVAKMVTRKSYVTRRRMVPQKCLLSDVIDDGMMVRAQLFLCTAENVYPDGPNNANQLSAKPMCIIRNADNADNADNLRTPIIHNADSADNLRTPIIRNADLADKEYPVINSGDPRCMTISATDRTDGFITEKFLLIPVLIVLCIQIFVWLQPITTNL